MLTFCRDTLSTVTESDRRTQPIESTLANPGPRSSRGRSRLVSWGPLHLPERGPPALPIVLVH